jgi:hypothetical protein
VALIAGQTHRDDTTRRLEFNLSGPTRQIRGPGLDQGCHRAFPRRVAEITFRCGTCVASSPWPIVRRQRVEPVAGGTLRSHVEDVQLEVLSATRRTSVPPAAPRSLTSQLMS